MIANPDKYQTTVPSKIDSSVSHKLNIYDNNIGTTMSVKLLGIKITHQLMDNQHMSSFVQSGNAI